MSLVAFGWGRKVGPKYRQLSSQIKCWFPGPPAGILSLWWAEACDCPAGEKRFFLQLQVQIKDTKVTYNLFCSEFINILKIHIKSDYQEVSNFLKPFFQKINMVEVIIPHLYPVIVKPDRDSYYRTFQDQCSLISSRTPTSSSLQIVTRATHLNSAPLCVL